MLIGGASGGRSQSGTGARTIHWHQTRGNKVCTQQFRAMQQSLSDTKDLIYRRAMANHILLQSIPTVEIVQLPVMTVLLRPIPATLTVFTPPCHPSLEFSQAHSYGVNIAIYIS